MEMSPRLCEIILLIVFPSFSGGMMLGLRNNWAIYINKIISLFLYTEL
jgi:hypothetical protein